MVACADCCCQGTTYDERDCNYEQKKPPAMNGECWGENSYGQSNYHLNVRPYGWQPESICDAIFYSQVSGQMSARMWTGGKAFYCDCIMSTNQSPSSFTVLFSSACCSK